MSSLRKLGLPSFPLAADFGLVSRQQHAVLIASKYYFSGAEVSDDGRYVLLSVSEGCDPVNRLWYVDLQAIGGKVEKGPLPWVKLIDNFDAEYGVMIFLLRRSFVSKLLPRE